MHNVIHWLGRKNSRTLPQREVRKSSILARLDLAIEARIQGCWKCRHFARAAERGQISDVAENIDRNEAKRGSRSAIRVIPMCSQHAQSPSSGLGTLSKIVPLSGLEGRFLRLSKLLPRG